jgi:RimJ/RimL family protein N-acetyltransferase
MSNTIELRDVTDADLPIFFEQQLDPEAIHMAAFTAKNPADRDAFMAHWRRNMAHPTVMIRTIVTDGAVAGYVLSYEEDRRPEVSYWIGRAYWGRGIATRALTAFLTKVNATRPIYARVAQDNRGSLRVLEKAAFKIIAEDSGFANARGAEIKEWLLERKD